MSVDVVSNLLKNIYTHDIPRDISSYFIKVQGNVNNRESLSLINSMASTYTPPKYRLSNFNIKNKSLCEMRKTSKLYWDIIFTKGDVKFYLSMDSTNEELIVAKAKNVWNRCNISKMPITQHDLKILDLKTTTSKCTCSEMVLKTYNYKSISTDISNQYPLTNMLSITKALKKDEFVRVNIAIEPTSRLDWIYKAKDEKKAFDSGKILNNEIGLKEQLVKLGMDIANVGLDLYLELKMLPIECMFGLFLGSDLDVSKKDNKRERKRKDFHSRYDMYEDDDDIIESSFRRKSGSNYKSTSETFKTKITIISQSDDINRARINMIAVGNSYKDLTEDNELVMRIYEEKETIRAIEEIKNQEVNINKKCILSDKELCKLIQLPQKTLQDEYKMDVINTREAEDVPKELLNGKIRVGSLDEPSKNKKTVITMPQDSNALCKKTVIIGSENSGKTTQLCRLAKEYSLNGISNVVFDHQENGKFTDEVSRGIPKEKCVIYDIYNDMPPFAYVEIQSLIKEDMDKMLRLDYANMIAKQVILFVDSITDEETGCLTGRMKRFLHSACMVVFIKPNTVINDVFNVLTKYDVRNEYIRYAKYSNLFDDTDDIFTNLNELHRRKEDNKSDDKNGKILGTRDDLIAGILNRIATLKQNPRIKEMLKKPYDENDNLDRNIQKGVSIFIKVPQLHFPDNSTRDMICTFYFSRLWLTAQMRKENKDSKICHVIIDEIKSLPTLASFMEKHITEFRRNRIAMSIAVHGLQQFGKLLQQLLDAGSNFIILSPCEKKNIQALKEEIKPFELEDVMELKPFHALSVINYGNQYWRGIVKLYKD